MTYSERFLAIYCTYSFDRGSSVHAGARTFTASHLCVVACIRHIAFRCCWPIVAVVRSNALRTLASMHDPLLEYLPAH